MLHPSSAIRPDDANFDHAFSRGLAPSLAQCEVEKVTKNVTGSPSEFGRDARLTPHRSFVRMPSPKINQKYPMTYSGRPDPRVPGR